MMAAQQRGPTVWNMYRLFFGKWHDTAPISVWPAGNTPGPAPRAQLDTAAGERRLQPAEAQLPPFCRVNAAFRSEAFVRVGGSVKGLLPKSNGSADSHVRTFRTPLKISKILAKWITRTQRSALRAFEQHALKLR